MEQTVTLGRVSELLNEQRIESEARSILQEVERLNTIAENGESRWIWELMQNARDVAGKQGVSIRCDLSASTFKFSHNGQPFNSKHLLALVRKTSTKSYSGEDGNTGKFGTGFVLTHLLNKKVKIKGVHQNDEGQRIFEFFIDRTPTGLQEMMTALDAAFQNIENIDQTPPTPDNDEWHTYEYELIPTAFERAKRGLIELERNLAFTFLINPKIVSVSIIENDFVREYTSSIKEDVLSGISFISLKNDNLKKIEDGLLFKINGKATFGIPVIKQNDTFRILPIENQAHLFKEFPLIGTENFFIPVFFQHNDFLPTDQRDGVRTKKTNESEEDFIADKNRSALLEFVNEFPTFLEIFYQSDVRNIHLMALTGLPDNVKNYYGVEWYTGNVQKNLRESLFKIPLVNTASGDSITIDQAQFINVDDEHEESFFDLVSSFLPDKIPNQITYKSWSQIIYQDLENWPSDITIDILKLVQLISQKKSTKNFGLEETEAISKLQSLISYLEKTGNEGLSLDYNLYPNQSGYLKQQNEVYLDIGLDERIKSISERIGRKLEDELLNKDFKSNHIQPFKVKEFFNSLNVEISSLSLENATSDQIQAIIDICCTFQKSPASRREQWFALLNKLFQEKASKKFEANEMDDFNWEPAVKWLLKYVCSLIEKSKTVIQFSESFFQSSLEKTFDWLNEFLDFIFRNDENKEIGLRYDIIPTQDGVFKMYDDSLFREDNPQDFDETIKSLFKQYTRDGDTAIFLIDNRIKNEKLRQTDVKKLTSKIDELFHPYEAMDKVRDGGEYHTLFLNLKEWFESKENAGSLFPIFQEKQPELHIKAFGSGSKLMKLLKLKKSAEELKALDELSLNTYQLKFLDDAAKRIGSIEKLLEAARKMVSDAEDIRWRKEVGLAAEVAFRESLSEAEPTFLIENPDVGKDFVLRSKTTQKEYAIEIKSTVIGNESVKMSMTQGNTAVTEKERYALCVINRPSQVLVDKDYFIQEARFVLDIGPRIGDKIDKWNKGVQDLELEEDVSVNLSDKTGSVNIKIGVWKDGILFPDFISFLRDYFSQT